MSCGRCILTTVIITSSNLMLYYIIIVKSKYLRKNVLGKKIWIISKIVFIVIDHSVTNI